MAKSQQKTNAQLIDGLATALGVDPIPEYLVTGDGGQTYVGAFLCESSAQQYLQKYFAYPGYGVVRVERLPRFGLSAVKDKLNALGWCYTVACTPGDEKPYRTVVWGPIGGMFESHCKEEFHALASSFLDAWQYAQSKPEESQ